MALIKGVQEFGLIFRDLPIGADQKDCGFDLYGSPNHCTPLMIIGEYWWAYHFYANRVDLECLGLQSNMTASEVLIRTKRGSSAYAITRTRVPQSNYDLYGRPMYCQNWVIQLLGLEVGQCLTPEHFEQRLVSKNGLTNFEAKKVY